MKVNDLLILVRQRLGDMQKTKFSDNELIYCLNNAIDRLSGELVAKSNPEMVREFTITGTEGTKRPVDFVTLRGQYPIEFRRDVYGVTVFHSDPEFMGTMKVKYYSLMPHVKSLDDEIPFDQTPYYKVLVTYTLYDIKPSMEGGNNDSSGTNEQRSSS